MKIYVQSASQEGDDYWVEVDHDTEFEMLASYPHPRYEELLECLDPETPSLLIAEVPPRQLVLLLKGIVSQRRDRWGRFIQNSLLLIFDQAEETAVRVFAAMLLTPTEENQRIERASFHSRWLAQINSCITDGPLGTFQVDPALPQVVNTIIREGILEASRHSATLRSSKRVTLAKNSLQRRKELADLLYEVPLPLKRSQWKVIPLVVVTGNKSPEPLIRTGAWRVLTLLSEHELWYNPPKLNQNTLRFALIGVSVLCVVILALLILLLQR